MLGLLVVLSRMTTLRVFSLLQKYMKFLTILFHYVFQETKVEKLQQHPCSLNPVLGFTGQTELSTGQAEGPVPCTGRVKSEQ